MAKDATEQTAADKRAALKAKKGKDAGKKTAGKAATTKPSRARTNAGAKEREEPTDVEKLNAASMQRPDLVGDAHGSIATPSSAGEKCIVAFKAGIGFLDIQLQQRTIVQENTQTGPRDVPKFDRVGQVVRLRGTSYPRGTPPKGFPPPPVIVDGAALNPGIDRDFMENWMKQNALNPLVKNRLIFIAKDEASIRAIAAEEAKNLSGLDPVSTDGKDPRMPKPTRAELTTVATADRV